jgi:taurine--2-oxoglutarate transaminase
MATTAASGMSTEEIVRLSREHTFFSWSAQGAIDPIAIDRAEGVYLYTPEGQRILDFNSQLMSVNIGHGDRRVIDAITAQATKLQYVQPAFATEIRARLASALGIDSQSVSVKGKSNEGMGWIGRKEGLACIAVATLIGKR